MANVPLIPFKRPEPKVFAKREEAKSKELLRAAQAAAKHFTKPKQKVKSMSAKTKPKAQAFEYQNTERIEDKPEVVQFAWQILSTMDPDGELFVNDKALVILQGAYKEEAAAAKENKSLVHPDTRRAETLGFDEDQIELLQRYAVPDAREEDEEGNIVEESIVGVVFTPYQLIEAVYELAYSEGLKEERRKVTSVLTEAAEDADDEDDWDPDEDEDEDEDDSEEEDSDEDDSEDDEDFDDDDMDVIDEDEEYDEEEDDDS